MRWLEPSLPIWRPEIKKFENFKPSRKQQLPRLRKREKTRPQSWKKKEQRKDPAPGMTKLGRASQWMHPPSRLCMWLP